MYGVWLINAAFPNTPQKIRFSIKDFFGKCDQIRSFLWIWSHLPKKSLMENFIFCAVHSLVMELKAVLLCSIIKLHFHINNENLIGSWGTSIKLRQSLNLNFWFRNHDQTLISHSICGYLTKLQISHLFGGGSCVIQVSHCNHYSLHCKIEITKPLCFN